MCVYMFVTSFALEEGAGQEPVGGGRRWDCYIYIGGRGRARTGRRGEDGVIVVYSYKYIYRRKGPCGSR